MGNTVKIYGKWCPCRWVNDQFQVYYRGKWGYAFLADIEETA